METREIDEAAQQLEVARINVHGAFCIVSGDIEIFNSRFGDALKYFSVQFELRPARHNNELGIVERNNAVGRVFIGRLLKDAFNSSQFVTDAMQRKELFSRAVYLSKSCL